MSAVAFLPAPRRLASLLMRDPAALSSVEAAIREGIRTDPEFALARDLARRFTPMIQRQEVDALDP